VVLGVDVDHDADLASEGEIRRVRNDFFTAFGQYPRLDDPRTFNEKIAWRKLFQRDPRFTVFADKFAVKGEIAKLVGPDYVVETLWVGDQPEKMPLEKLPPPFAIKVTHGCDGHTFLEAGSVVNRFRLNARLRQYLGECHAEKYGEWGYRHIPRRILVERMIVMPDGRFPDDFRFYVYHGRVRFIQVEHARFSFHVRSTHDRDWRLLPMTDKYPMPETPMARPARLAEMIAIAETIGAQFDFVRVDLYAPPERILFGEATFYPAGGFKMFEPAGWDDEFGAPWNLGVL
jgi:hypothetical protein